jgi:hypothetical protein
MTTRRQLHTELQSLPRSKAVAIWHRHQDAINAMQAMVDELNHMSVDLAAGAPSLHTELLPKCRIMLDTLQASPLAMLPPPKGSGI